MVVEVKILQMTYKALAVVFYRLIEVLRPCPFKKTLLRGPLIYFSFDLNSINYTIVEIKT